MPTPDLENVIEGLVDSTSLTDVLDALAAVCAAKAEHLAVNWQDHASSREWERNARVVAQAAQKVRE